MQGWSTKVVVGVVAIALDLCGEVRPQTLFIVNIGVWGLGYQ